MKASKLNSYLGKILTDRWVGKKFEDIKEVHNDIKDTVNNIVKEHGLEYVLWGLRIDGEYGTNIIKYSIDYNADKRFKYDTKGRVTKITFKSLLLDENATIEELKNEKKKWNVLGNIARLEKHQIELQKELEENKKYLEELKKELEIYA